MKKKLPFYGYEEGYGYPLLCPVCNEQWLHHDSVEIFDRKQDEQQGLHIKVEDHKLTQDTDLTGNPSLRRHGLTIRFWCEGCDSRSLFSISQHKGRTLLEIEPLEVATSGPKIEPL